MLDTIREVHTPEGVALPLMAAGPFPRALAWLIDACVRIGLLLAASGGLAALGGLGSGAAYIVMFAVLWLYPVLFEVMWNGQTIGKRVFRLRVVAANGAPVGWMAAFARNLLRVVDMLPIGYAAGLVSCLVDPWGRRLGDLVAGTQVVYIPHTPRVAGIAVMPPQPPLLALTPEEQCAVIAFAERAQGLPPARQQELAELAQPVTGKTGQAGVEALLGVGHWLLGKRA